MLRNAQKIKTSIFFARPVSFHVRFKIKCLVINGSFPNQNSLFSYFYITFRLKLRTPIPMNLFGRTVFVCISNKVAIALHNFTSKHVKIFDFVILQPIHLKEIILATIN